MTHEMRGMKQRELREAAECGICHRKIGEAGVPLFYRVTIERWGVMRNAVMRQSGLEMVLRGSAALAQAMGPDEDLAVEVMDPVTFTVCEGCAYEKNIAVGVEASRGT